MKLVKELFKAIDSTTSLRILSFLCIVKPSTLPVKTRAALGQTGWQCWLLLEWFTLSFVLSPKSHFYSILDTWRPSCPTSWFFPVRVFSLLRHSKSSRAAPLVRSKMTAFLIAIIKSKPVAATALLQFQDAKIFSLPSPKKLKSSKILLRNLQWGYVQRRYFQFTMGYSHKCIWYS